jgi:hypothetical protein
MLKLGDGLTAQGGDRECQSTNLPSVSVATLWKGASSERVSSSPTPSPRCGLEIFTFRTYPAEIKGGQAMIQVRTAERPIYSHGDEADILICFDEEAWERHRDEFNPDGVLILRHQV